MWFHLHEAQRQNLSIGFKIVVTSGEGTDLETVQRNILTVLIFILSGSYMDIYTKLYIKDLCTLGDLCTHFKK